MSLRFRKNWFSKHTFTLYELSISIGLPISEHKHTSYNFEIDLLENDITMTFNSLKSLIFFLNRQFFIFLYKSNTYRTVVKRENYETRKRLKLAKLCFHFLYVLFVWRTMLNKHRIVIHKKKGNISCYARISIRTSK